MEELYKERRIRAIGVCNFDADQITDLFLQNEIKSGRMPSVLSPEKLLSTMCQHHLR